jgi:murein DD-endopeptidase MepM/ murein hydrolase activator NlpD
MRLLNHRRNLSQQFLNSNQSAKQHQSLLLNMSHQSNSGQNEPPFANDLVESSPKNFLDIVKLATNPYVKLSIFLSLGVAVHLPGFNRAVRANDSAHLSSSTQNLGSWRSRSKISKIPILLPRILNVAFSAKSQTADALNDATNLTVSPSLPLGIKSKELYSDGYSQKLDLAKTSDKATVKMVKSPQQIYQVQQGDTISKIAKKYQVSNDDLVSINQISDSNIIFVNQRLKIPLSQVLADKIKSQDKPTAKGSDPLDLRQKTAASSMVSRNNANSAKLDEDPYIAKLRAEIDLLRAQNQQKSEINDVPVSFSEKSNSEAEYQSKTNQLNSAKSKVKSNSPLPELSFSSNLLEEETIALRLPLPPLPDSNEYLPGAFDGYIWPAQGVLTSGYGWRWGRSHNGIDIAAPIGTPIFAAASGKVVGAGWHSGYGNVVKLEHLDGSFTLYAHNNRIMVEHGQQVNQGEQIAEMGSTGNSTGSHVHFEIHTKEDQVINPLALLDSK